MFLEEEREEFLKNPDNIEKFFTYTSYWDGYNNVKPTELEDGSMMIVDIYENKVVRVLFAPHTTAKAITAWVKSQDSEINLKEIKKTDFINWYKTSDSCKRDKQFIRNAIREEKDIEDDLTDQKIIIQNMFYFICEIWKHLPTEQKNLNKYKDIMDGLTASIESATLRADLEDTSKLLKLLNDEQHFSELAKIYLDRKKGIMS